MASLALWAVRILRKSPVGPLMTAHLDRCAAYAVFGPLELLGPTPKLNLSHVLGIKAFPDLRIGEFVPGPGINIISAEVCDRAVSDDEIKRLSKLN